MGVPLWIVILKPILLTVLCFVGNLNVIEEQSKSCLEFEYQNKDIYVKSQIQVPKKIKR